MPHWRRAGRWDCVAGTEGHAPPAALSPAAEPVVEKTSFQRVLQPGARRTARAAWDRGPGRLRRPPARCAGPRSSTPTSRAYRVGVPDVLLVGSYDGLHSAATRRYLEGRAGVRQRRGPARPPSRPRRGRRRTGRGCRGSGRRSDRGSGPRMARPAGRGPGGVPRARGRRDRGRGRGARHADRRRGRQATALRPRRGRAARRAPPCGAAAARRRIRPAMPRSDASRSGPSRRSPRSTIRWPCPAANSPRPFARQRRGLEAVSGGTWPGRVARRAAEEAGVPPSWCRCSGAEAAAALMRPGRRRGSLTGSSRAGFAAQAICAHGGSPPGRAWRQQRGDRLGRRDLAAPAAAIAEAGFGAAGSAAPPTGACRRRRQLCRVPGELEAASAALEIGEPADPGVHVGPLFLPLARDWVSAVLERAAESSRCASRCAIATPWAPDGGGPYHAPRGPRRTRTPSRPGGVVRSSGRGSA